MARFTRSGGEACSVAIRIARAASGKDKVAFVAIRLARRYISTNLSKDNNLDGRYYRVLNQMVFKSIG